MRPADHLLSPIHYRHVTTVIYTGFNCSNDPDLSRLCNFKVLLFNIQSLHSGIKSTCRNT